MREAPKAARRNGRRYSTAVGYLKPARLMIQAGKSGARTMAPRSR
jgi:hypothetical protein